MNIQFMREVGFGRFLWLKTVRQFHKRVLRRPHQMRLPTGLMMQLPPSSRFGTEVFITGARVDWGSEELLFSLLNKCGVFLDVGANIGYYSLYMLPKVKGVYAFEPDPRARKDLQVNLAGFSNAEIVPYAVGLSNREISFALDSFTETSRVAEREDSIRDQIKIRMVTIDSFVAERSLIVEAIKIDAEGHDLDVLRGAEQTMRSQSPIILTEVKATAEVLEFARSVNYRIHSYVRPQGSLATSLEEIAQPLSPQKGTKMLFFLPQSLNLSRSG